MLTITAQKITKEEAVEHEVECDAVDYAAVRAAEIKESDTFEGCSQVPEYAVSFRPAEDMVIPHFLCPLHFAALRLSLHEGVAVDEDVFGEFPNR